VEETISMPPQKAQTAPAFASVPACWYYIGRVADLSRGPVRFDLPEGHQYVGFRTEAGRLAVLSGRCCHMSADLSVGCVKGGRIACPLHGWEFGVDGRCEYIPASTTIPSFARVMSFPVEERASHVFFFNRPEARFPMPFFQGVDPAQLVSARCFELTIDTPWQLASANSFDVQHFFCAHDRRLLGEPCVTFPNKFAMELQARFAVAGDSLRDRLTANSSGPEVEMTVTNWLGNLILVKAKFRRTTSYGIVSFVPLENGRTKIRNIVLAPRSASALGRLLIDPLDAIIRRSFIRAFVRSDVERSHGIRFHPDRVIEADKMMVDYLDWLLKIHR
jgi:nitrite reductase/ring-hydroxylating ferredoxin subunit